ncbi:transcriptional regulator MraZ [Egibacter rhizosphaerae]|uniref:Transcriptional regulator MraZ n=1 Tax=Egibacter rhizosphaerae TaxID=1670831 RepID=A0A411YA97_9ACTN|nr:division/cell wall cluster transcriptional repressor MraZ [Egibacter rhizosphaerae]QBI18140.1 transcriptional regulator MraZ [Egibacter rhizosphaerae]
MFLGEYQHTLDSKGRLILPSAFRERLQEGVVLTIETDRCLSLYPQSDWERMLEGLRELRTTSERERKYARMLLSSAHPDALDRQGRVTLPARLREYADFTRDVTVVGADTRIELWDRERWESYRSEAMEEFAATDSPFELGGL